MRILMLVDTPWADLPVRAESLLVHLREGHAVHVKFAVGEPAPNLPLRDPENWFVPEAALGHFDAIVTEGSAIFCRDDPLKGFVDAGGIAMTTGLNWNRASQLRDSGHVKTLDELFGCVVRTTDSGWTVEVKDSAPVAGGSIDFKAPVAGDIGKDHSEIWNNVASVRAAAPVLLDPSSPSAAPLALTQGSTLILDGRPMWINPYSHAWAMANRYGYGWAITLTGDVAVIANRHADNAIWCQQTLEHFHDLSLRHRQLLRPAREGSGIADSVMPTADLLAEGESETTEFKATCWTDLRTGEKPDWMPDNVVKTVAAFMNTHGGTLVIGVGDDGTVTGLEQDAHGNDADKYQRRLSDLLRNRLSVPPALLSMRIEPLPDGTICRVDVPRMKSSVYAQVKGNQQPETFFVRSGSQTLQLSGPAMEQYVRNRDLRTRPPST